MRWRADCAVRSLEDAKTTPTLQNKVKNRAYHWGKSDFSLYFGQARPQNFMFAFSLCIGNQPATYGGRPEVPTKSLENVSRGLRPPKKSPKHSKNTLQTLSGDSPETSRTVAETFWRLFGVPGPEALGNIFETFSAFRARRAQETSAKGGLVPNLCTELRIILARWLEDADNPNPRQP